jgi:2'-5' RNA ligase
MIPPLIVTLKLDQSTFERANALRQQYFPPDRNLVPAHITLFHALPGEQETVIKQHLQRVCGETPKIVLELPSLRFLGQGVAIEVEAPALVALRQSLAKTWQDWLTRQDRQRYQPHITIQNKVAGTIARQTYEQLLERWQPLNAYGEGLLLWYYCGGLWELAEAFLFTSAA